MPVSKCRVKELSEAYECLFRDAMYAYPTLKAEFERDLIRLRALVERDGIRVFLEYLPAVGKHFDRCLSGGHYSRSGLPLTKRSSGRIVCPKFLRGLYLMVFHECGRLKDDYNVEAIFFVRQILYAAKKVDFPCSQEKIDDAVIDLFQTDSELPIPEGYWKATTPRELSLAPPYLGFGKSEQLRTRLGQLGPGKSHLSIFLTNLDRVSRLVVSALGIYDPVEWRFRHGPGAISDAIGPTNKYCWTNWSSVLESEYPIADYGYHSFSSWVDDCTKREVGSTDPSSRLVAVPKSFSGPRLIAAEPREHQWCQ